MKNFYRFILVLASLIGSALAAQAPHSTPLPPPPPPPSAPATDPTGPPQPVYFYLYAKVTDHVNMDITEARLRRLLPMIEQYRKDNPQAHVSATIFFTGAVSQALADQTKKTHIKDFVLKYKKMGVIEIGYDGTDEPTYDHRPMIDESIEQKPFQERWLERAGDDEKLLTEARDPLTGDPRPGVAGGLKEMQEIFGPAACISGASVGEKMKAPLINGEHPDRTIPYTTKAEVGDWELVPVLRRYNTEAILSGLSATNRDYLPGYGGSVAEIGRIVSPEPDTAPELFWADDVLRFSEAGGGGSRLVLLNGGPDPIKNATAKLDRSRIHIFHVELDNENDYVTSDFAKGKMFTPALTYAYAHPDKPQVPADARLSPAAVETTHGKEEAALKWLITEYVPISEGNRVVSNSDLRRMTPASFGFTLTTADLRAALKQTFVDLGSANYLAPYFQVGGRYLSVAETFQVLTDALAEMNRTGKLPETVRVDRVYGPLAMAMGHGPNIGDVKAASVIKICADLDAHLHDDTGYPVPKNTIPPLFTVDAVKMNAAQFLRLMAQVLEDPSPDATLHVRMDYMLTGAAQVFPKARNLEDVGATWTFKPAPLNQTDAAKSNSSRFTDETRHSSEAF
jgi:hypothetical protein